MHPLNIPRLIIIAMVYWHLMRLMPKISSLNLTFQPQRMVVRFMLLISMLILFSSEEFKQ